MITQTRERELIEITVEPQTNGKTETLPAKPNGPAAAAILAAGIGCLALGLAVVFSEAIPAFKNALAFVGPVGPLSGKTDLAVVAYLLSWGVLGMLWKGKDVNFGKVYAATLILLALGFLCTFPIFYDVFTAH